MSIEGPFILILMHTEQRINKIKGRKQGRLIFTLINQIKAML